MYHCDKHSVTLYGTHCMTYTLTYPLTPLKSPPFLTHPHTLSGGMDQFISLAGMVSTRRDSTVRTNF